MRGSARAWQSAYLRSFDLVIIASAARASVSPRSEGARPSGLHRGFGCARRPLVGQFKRRVEIAIALMEPPLLA